LAQNLELAIHAKTGDAGKVAAEEIRREAKVRGLIGSARTPSQARHPSGIRLGSHLSTHATVLPRRAQHFRSAAKNPVPNELIWLH
jgi:hypothetical protein